jgi:hypothetical protein
MMGVALRIAASRISSPGVGLRLGAGERLAQDPLGEVLLAALHELGREPAVIRLAGTVSYLVLRGMLVRRGI